MWNAEPNARRKGSWLSTAYVSHVPLVRVTGGRERSGDGSGRTTGRGRGGGEIAWDLVSL